MIEKALIELTNGSKDKVIKTSYLSNDLVAYQIRNDSGKSIRSTIKHSKQMIHFFFSLSGNIDLKAVNLEEEVVLNESTFAMFSFPFAETTIEINQAQDAEVFSFIFSMKALHEIFGSSFGSDESQMKTFMESYEMKKFFVERNLKPSMSIIINQFFNGVSRENIQKIYQQGKIMEFLSLYMDTPQSIEEAGNNCPYVMDAFEMSKIKEARDIIIDNMLDPPSLKSLAKQVGTNEFKLKMGFKSVFHNTVYGYLNDHRMEVARKLLTVDKLLIKEVSSQVGYSNPSHFITAYKRKYGTTPKQHIKSLQ